MTLFFAPALAYITCNLSLSRHTVHHFERNENEEKERKRLQTHELMSVLTSNWLDR